MTASPRVVHYGLLYFHLAHRPEHPSERPRRAPVRRPRRRGRAAAALTAVIGLGAGGYAVVVSASQLFGS